jgi:hypothetical protein
MDVRKFYYYYGKSPGFLRVMATDHLRQTKRLLMCIKRGPICPPDEMYDRIIAKSQRVYMLGMSRHAKRCKSAYLEETNHTKRVNEFITFIDTYQIPDQH